MSTVFEMGSAIGGNWWPDGGSIEEGMMEPSRAIVGANSSVGQVLAPSHQFFMRSYEPSSKKDGADLVKFQILSKEFGAGRGEMTVRMPMEKNSRGLYSTCINGSWNLFGNLSDSSQEAGLPAFTEFPL